MAITKIEGKLVKLEISTNLVTPAYKMVVCAEDSTLDGSTDVNTRNTKCGVFKSNGNVSWTLSGSGVANATPDSDELSADEILTLFQDSTNVLWKLTHETGDTIIYREGQGFFSAYSEGHPADDLVGFDYTLEVDGTIEIAA
jgi:hypothetical protein